MKAKAKKSETGNQAQAVDGAKQIKEANKMKSIEAKLPAITKAKADFKAMAAEKAKSKQAERLSFIETHGKKLADLWSKTDKPTSMGIWRAAFPKAEQPCRMVDYALVALGIRETTDKGLLAWKAADGFNTQAMAARPNPAPKKSKVVKTKKA